MRVERNAAFDSSDLLVCLCFFLSGLAALVYQTVWARLFSISFGTSELAIATVLAAYMGGLAIGSALVSRYADRVERPVFAYALLEGAIGLSALAVPLLIGGAGLLYAAVLGGRDLPPPSADFAQLTFYVFATFAIILVPTACMGATLPLLNRFLIRQESHVGPRTGLLYGLNTAGAVVGVLLATFLLLPSMGLQWVQAIAVAVNLLIFGLAWVLFRSLREHNTEPEALERGPGETIPAASRLLHPVTLVLLASGAVSFLYEVLWTRMLGQLVGSSIYAFGIMLAAFLSGIALGGLVVGRFAGSPSQARTRLAYAQILIGVLGMCCFLFISSWPVAEFSMSAKFWVAGLIMLPATLAIGATFPLAVRAVAASEREIGQVSARIYSFNTLGAILGAVGTGFLLLPWLGFSGTAKLAMLVNLLLALVLIYPARGQILSKCLATSLVLAVTVTAFWSIPRPVSLIEQVPEGFASISNGEEVAFSVGRNTSVLVLEFPDQIQIRTNGLPEAGAPRAGGWQSGADQAWLTILPIWQRPEADSMMIIGLGGGVMLEPLPHDFGRIDVVELESEVVEANRLMGPLRRIDGLQNPSLNLVVNDARNALRLTDSRYDLLVSQPSHPWTAGASHLFSGEFVDLVKSRLTEDGVFVQWMNLEFVDENLLRDMAATLLLRFEHVRLYSSHPSALTFVASDAALESEQSGMEPTIYIRFRNQGIYDIAQLRAALQIDEQGMELFAAGGMPVTDSYNQMMLESYPDASGLTLPSYASMLEPYDAWVTPDEHYFGALPREERFRLLRALARSVQYSRGQTLVDQEGDFADRNFWLGLVAAENDRFDLALAGFRQVLDLLPDSAEAQYGYAWALWNSGEVDSLAQATDDPRINDVRLISTLRAWTAGNAKDWQLVSGLLEEVATTRPGDSWYGLALETLAWGQLLTRETTTQQYLTAISLLDECLRLVGENAQRLELRANLAFQLGLTDHYLYGLDRMLRFFQSYFSGAEGVEAAQARSVEAALYNALANLNTLSELSDRQFEYRNQIMSRIEALRVAIQPILVNPE